MTPIELCHCSTVTPGPYEDGYPVCAACGRRVVPKKQFYELPTKGWPEPNSIEERRFFAAMAMVGLSARYMDDEEIKEAAYRAVSMADTIIAKLNETNV